MQQSQEDKLVSAFVNQVRNLDKEILDIKQSVNDMLTKIESILIQNGENNSHIFINTKNISVSIRESYKEMWDNLGRLEKKIEVILDQQKGYGLYIIKINNLLEKIERKMKKYEKHSDEAQDKKLIKKSLKKGPIKKEVEAIVAEKISKKKK